MLLTHQTGPVPLPERRLNWDPGGLRSEELFKSVYGENEAGVRKNLVRIPFLNQTIAFQKKSRRR
jgi:hypothetical protein